MAVTTDTLNVKIQIDAKGAKANLKGFEKTLQKLEKDFGAMGKSVAIAGRALQGFGAKVVVVNQSLDLLGRAMSGVSRVADNTIGQFATFEQALVGVGKTTDISGSELEALGTEVQNLAKRIPVSTNELLELAKSAGQLGVKGSDNILLFTETIAKLGSASDVSGEEAATALARILNVTGEAISNVDVLASVIVRLGNNAAAGEKEIINMTNEVARSTKVFGISSVQAAALATTMREVGIRAELGGSTVGRAFNAINNAIQTGGKSFRRLQELTKMTGDQLKETFRKDAITVFEEFIAGLGQLDNLQIGRALEEFNLKGEEVLKTLPVLATGTEQFRKNLALMRDELENTTALNEEARKAFETLSSSFIKLVNRIRVLAVNFSAIFAPAIQSAIDSISQLIDFMETDAFIKPAKAIMSFTVAVGGTVLAIQALNSALGLLAFAGFTSAVIKAKIATFSLTAALGSLEALAGTLLIKMGALPALLKTVAAGLLAISVKVAGVLALALAFDILIRNVGRLDKLFELIKLSLENFLNEGILLVKNFNNNLNEIGKTVSKAINIFGILDSHIEGYSKTQEKRITEANKLLNEQAENTKRIEELATEIDFGFAEDIIEALKPTIVLAETMKKTADGAGETSDKVKQLNGDLITTAEELQRLSVILDKNKQIQAAIDQIGKTRIEQIKIQAALEQQLVNTKIQSGEITKQEEAALRRQVQLIEQLAQKQIAQIAADSVKDLIQQNQQLSAQVDNIGATQEQQIKRNLDLQLQMLNAKRFELREQIKVNSELGKQLDKREKLLREGAEKQIGEIQKGPQLFDTEQLSQVGSMFGGAAKGMLGAASSMLSVPTAMMAAVSMILDVFQKIVDFIPGILNKAAKLFNSLANLGPTISKAFQGLLDGLMNFVKNFSVNMTEMVGSLIDGIMNFVQEFPKAFMDSLPRIVAAIFKVLDKLPEFLTVMVEESIAMAPEMAFAFIETLAANLPEMLAKSIKSSLVDLPKALINAIINGFKRIFKAIGDFFSGKGVELGQNVAMGLTDGIRDFGEELTKNSNQIFSVLDDAVVAKGRSQAEEMRDGLASGVQSAVSWMVKRWHEFLQSMREAGAWISDRWKEFIVSLEAAWQWVDENILVPLGDIGTQIWNGLKDGLNAIGDFGTMLWEGFLEPIGNFFGDMGTMIWTAFADLASAAGDLLGNLGTMIWDGLKGALKGVKDIFKGLGKAIWDGLKEVFDFGSLFSGSEKDILKKLTGIGLAQGGIVPEYAATGKLFQRRGTDTVPAMLTPGEFVMKRSSVDSIGAQNLQTMNRTGQMPQQGNSVNVSLGGISITASNIDRRFVENELMDTIKEQLRRASQNGELIISQQGVY